MATKLKAQRRLAPVSVLDHAAETHEEYVGRFCQRQPYGRECKILARGVRGYLIQDRFWKGWVTPKTFTKKWMIAAMTNEVV